MKQPMTDQGPMPTASGKDGVGFQGDHMGSKGSLTGGMKGKKFSASAMSQAVRKKAKPNWSALGSG